MLKKSLDNKIMGEKALKEGYDHIFVSRYYYSIYQKIIYICEDLNAAQYVMRNGNKAGSHEKYIYGLSDYLSTVKKDKEIVRTITSMIELKKLRQKADYKSEELSKANIKATERYYHKLDKALSRYL